MKNMDQGLRVPGFKSQLGTLNKILKLFLSKMRKIRVPLTHKALVNIK